MRSRSIFHATLQTNASGGWLLVATLLAACGNNGKFSVIHEPPAVTITSPTPGSTFYAGELVNFQALAQVYDTTDITTVGHRWVGGSELMCEGEFFSADGYGTCAYAFPSAGMWNVQVTATDPDGDRATHQIEIEVLENTPPSIDVIDPLDGADYAIDNIIVVSALVGDVEQDPATLTVTASSSIDGPLAVTGIPSSTGDFSTALTLSPGSHLVTFLVADAYGQSDQDTVQIDVFESLPPQVESVSIDPLPAYTEDDLLAVPYGWNDLTGGSPRYRYQWFKDDGTGLMIADTPATTETYPAGRTVKGDQILVEIVPYNTYGDGPAVRSSIIEILNSPPTAPVIGIDPADPEPTDSLFCAILSPSVDADGDPITYAYAWFRNGALTPITANVVTPDLLAHGDTWECVVTPNDGEVDGANASDAVSVFDATAPSAPILDAPYSFRNEDSVTLTGSCEAACDLTFYCADGLTSWTDTGTCSGSGTLAYSTTLTRGQSTSCYATCTDGAGNLSPNSNTVSTEVCNPEDIYEDSTGYGDAGADSVNEWGTLSDSGASTITIRGNILADDSEDWYVIQTSDDLASDRLAGINYYNFEVYMTSGSGDYQFYVYKGTADATDRECSTGAAYTEYNDFVSDRGDSVHGIPTDPRRCGVGSSTLNECESLANTYYIQVSRLRSSALSCDSYTLEITNGVW